MIRSILEWCLVVAAAAAGVVFGLSPVLAAVPSASVTAVTTDVATYGVLVSTIMGAVILVVLARVGWALMRRLLNDDLYGDDDYEEVGDDWESGVIDDPEYYEHLEQQRLNREASMSGY